MTTATETTDLEQQVRHAAALIDYWCDSQGAVPLESICETLAHRIGNLLAIAAQGRTNPLTHGFARSLVGVHAAAVKHNVEGIRDCLTGLRYWADINE